MRHILYFASCILLALGVAAAEPIVMPLYPDGPPDDNGLKGPERPGGCIGNVSVPTLTVHLPDKDKATGAAVVITPGGGYGVVCAKTEGKAIADILVPRGIAAIVLKYRLPNKNHLIPANDARRALRTVRANAKAWGVDPGRVGVWGFSAGGHLASTVTTVFDKGKANAADVVEQQSSRPDFSILFYPVISMEDGVTHGGSKNNLIGGNPELTERYSNENRVTKETPPTFILHAGDDHVVKVENALRFYQALVKNKVKATCVIYEKGGHGPGAFLRNPSWVHAFDEWLKTRGLLK
jgi:acetyl esterase/lipase